MHKYIRFFIFLLFFTIISVLIYKYRRSIPTPQSIVENIAPAPTVIQKNGLPNKHLIKTIFIPQAPEKIWDQPWQDSCEEAALLTVYYYYKNINPGLTTILADFQKIFDLEKQENLSHDVNINQMATISAKLWDYQTKIIDNPTIDEFKKYLSQNIPIIIPANGKTLFKENTHFKSGGPWYHNIVLLGYDDDKKIFTVHDVGTQFGPYFHYTYGTLMKSIHDFPVSLNKEDIDIGTPRVLLLLK